MSLPETVKADGLEATDRARRLLKDVRSVEAEVSARLMHDIFGLFDEPGFQIENFEAASYVAMMTMKALEDRFPLGVILHELNAILVLRTFENLRRFRTEELGPSVREFLTYLTRFRPYIHPLIGLTASALLNGKTKAPAESHKKDYEALKEYVALRPNRALENLATPHVLYGNGRENKELILTDVRLTLSLIDEWFLSHGLKTYDWQTHKGFTPEILAEKATKRAALNPVHLKCEGFLIN